MATTSLYKRYPCWNKLKKNSYQLKSKTLQSLLAANPERSQCYSLQAANITLNYSRHWLNDSTLALFNQLWKQARVSKAVEKLLNGEIVNSSENRPAWHTALRSPQPPREIKTALVQMEQLTNKIHSGQWKGFKGSPITDVVNIGIGGSDLGPRMVTDALSAFHVENKSGNSLTCHFVSNVDPADITDTLKKLNPETTLFIIASKSFTTLETLANATLARQWFLQQGNQNDIAKHFIAISTDVGKAKQFGIPSANVFPMWDWVGGRYSLWSAIGLPIALSCGMEHFYRLLQGAHAMDEHVHNSKGTENLSAMLAFLEIWYSHFFQAQSHAVLPYSHRLKLLPDFLQQLTMESNGKQVTTNGAGIDYPTGSILWGAAGTNGQHSFHQLLHQGTHLIPADFILPLATTTKDSSSYAFEQINTQQRHLIANCLAQSEALLYGRSAAQIKQTLKNQGHTQSEIKRLTPHLIIPGNRPHSLITFNALTPETLGALIALYEHKTYIQSIILNINALDQWGVELGKQLSTPIYEALDNPEINYADGITKTIIDTYQRLDK